MGRGGGGTDGLKCSWLVFTIAMLTVTSPIVINVPTSDLLVVETKVILFCG